MLCFLIVTLQRTSTKTSYILYYGLAPHFKEMLLDNLKEVPHFVPCYNKWYNSVIKKGQMDVLVRCWYVNLNKVSTCYSSSQFMCKAAAEDALAKFESASSDLYKSKFMQVSSGRPNVNLEFLDLLNEK